LQESLQNDLRDVIRIGRVQYRLARALLQRYPPVDSLFEQSRERSTSLALGEERADGTQEQELKLGLAQVSRLLEQHDVGYAEGSRHLAQHVRRRWVPAAGFELGDVCAGDLRGLRKGLLGEAGVLPQNLQILAKGCHELPS
jgi:hypothetical protein